MARQLELEKKQEVFVMRQYKVSALPHADLHSVYRARREWKQSAQHAILRLL
jgi:hypothetical protein